jgi:hypothetical protein
VRRLPRGMPTRGAAAIAEIPFEPVRNYCYGEPPNNGIVMDAETTTALSEARGGIDGGLNNINVRGYWQAKR